MFSHHKLGAVTQIRNGTSSWLDTRFVPYLHKLIRGCDLNCVCPSLESKKQKSGSTRMGVGWLWSGLFWMLVQKISWLHVRCRINLYTMRILLADSWKKTHLSQQTKTKEEAICLEMFGQAEINSGTFHRHKWSLNWSGSNWRHANSPFSLRRTPRLVTESVMERVKVNESSRWWWWLEVTTLDEEKSSSLIFFTKKERGMFQWMKTQSWEKHMRKSKKKKRKDPLKMHTSRAGLAVILVDNVVINIRQEKKWKPVVSEADGNAGWCSLVPPASPGKNKKK